SPTRRASSATPARSASVTRHSLLSPDCWTISDASDDRASMRVMILAAGKGERLRPLTDTVPKAMVEVGGKPLIAWHLGRLAGGGYGEAVVNAPHLAERIVEGLGDGGRYGVRIAYSREREPLETAGGIAKAQPLLGEAPFLLVNADIYCEFDFSA